MLVRNIVEIIIILALVTIGISIYIYAKKRIDDIESDITIRKKIDIYGEKLEGEEADT